MAATRTDNQNDAQVAPFPRRRMQFSIWTLLVVMTAICIMLAIPGAAILFASVGFWLIVAAGIVLVILALQAPGYYLLRRIRSASAAELEAPPPDAARHDRPRDASASEAAAPGRCE